MRKQLIKWILSALIISSIVVVGVDTHHMTSLHVEAKVSQMTVQEHIDEALPGVVCWGDSITEGMLGEGVTYPGTLQTLIDQRLIEPIRVKTGYRSLKAPIVVNMGVSGERSTEIAARQGGLPAIVTSAFTIPAGTTPVNFEYASPYKLDTTKLILYCDGGVNPVSIAGVQGKLTKYFDASSDRSRYRFQRLKAGKVVNVPVGTPMQTAASNLYRDYIPIIAMGSNGGWDTVQDLITQYQLMLNHQTNPSNRFLALGMMENYDTNIQKVNAEERVMGQYFGDHYMSIRKELNSRGLQIAGLSPTAADAQRIRAGWIPVSLLNKDDLLHYTPTGYAVLGELVYQKMDSLGYFNDLKILAQ